MNTKTKAIQKRLLEIAIEFKCICDQNNLQYFIAGGSLLGAIRHKGFIPWDDDMDFCMPREDYQKFLKIAPDLLSKHLTIRNFKTDGKNFCVMYSQIHDTTSTFLVDVFPSGHQHIGGIMIDIFPLDGTFQNTLLRKIHFTTLSFFQNIRNLAFYLDEKQHWSFFKKNILKIMRLTCRGATMYYVIDFLLRLKKYKNAKYVGEFGSTAYGDKQILEKNIYEKSKDIFFEGVVFKSPNNADFYLRRFYGDYMTFPPKEQQIGHAVFCNLEKSYLQLQQGEDLHATEKNHSYHRG
ncbi:LicD family protein [Helicobacter brantae]|uniref:LicD/FKTN/FKRP nucleotidyltransferase domain-containing protein n=1 Tax=Helicobacter brantae TaxID=375927 RepID=A0A3D8J403_9HELI|nr:LicD family protein [Helicobacter brantae]RDU72153.1 hypothetical protein CQA58_00680 [Helicobacter brantae]